MEVEEGSRSDVGSCVPVGKEAPFDNQRQSYHRGGKLTVRALNTFVTAYRRRFGSHPHSLSAQNRVPEALATLKSPTSGVRIGRLTAPRSFGNLVKIHCVGCTLQ